MYKNSSALFSSTTARLSVKFYDINFILADSDTSFLCKGIAIHPWPLSSILSVGRFSLW